ncbi:MAG: retroviral-like aspartic protease family protein [Candidatus Kerfeldbacteria bacterium]|nr:retroviral-like aspartic protease family protein [Candidatus Kerfeldbacteria bacterium]
MGIVNTSLKIKNPSDLTKIYEGDFLVDTGAQYTVLPQAVWKKLDLHPQRRQKFSLADGSIVERLIGSAYVELQGTESVTPVVLGKKDDSFILGVVTLENLGFSINPFNRELYPAKLML